jgi:hypothetical protein
MNSRKKKAKTHLHEAKTTTTTTSSSSSGYCKGTPTHKRRMICGGSDETERGVEGREREREGNVATVNDAAQAISSNLDSIRHEKKKKEETMARTATQTQTHTNAAAAAAAVTAANY